MTTRSRKAFKPAIETPSEPASVSPDEVLTVGEPEPLAPDPAEPETAEPVKETDPEQKGTVTLVYRGTADVLTHGPFRIRPGQPVTVPSDVAEELLTWPHERFEKVESQE